MNKSESKYFNTAVKMDEALISLLGEKDFEYITVSEVCKKAGVNRSTFYLHYENTSDLLTETTEHLFESFFAYFPDDLKDITGKLNKCDLSELNFMTEKHLHPYLSYIKENKRIFMTALTHINTFDFEGAYLKMFQQVFNTILDRFHYPVGDRKYVMQFYLNGINAIVTEWLKSDCEKSTEQMSKIIQQCVFGLDMRYQP